MRRQGATHPTVGRGEDVKVFWFFFSKKNMLDLG
jgi:hypothetical protein